MNKIIKTIGVLSLLIFFGCHDDDYSFGDTTAPTNLQIEANVIGATEEAPFGDGSGQVEFKASATNAVSLTFEFGDGRNATQSDGTYLHSYLVSGVNTFTVTLIANGRGGVKSSTSIEVTVFSEFSDPISTSLLTGDSTKTWYVASAQPGHLGVGPLDSFGPDFFSAPPNGLASCLYDDAITLSLENGNIFFNHDNAGVSFVNGEFVSQFGGGGTEDQCLPFDVSGQKLISLSSASGAVPEDQTVGTQINIADGGFFSYYINTSSYEILELTEDYMHVRAISGSVGNPLAWYLKYTTDPDGGGGSGDSDLLETQFETLAWSDEFDANGAPDSDTWNFELGNGDNGWGNQELQFYTQDNAVVEDGMLKITARAEALSGFDYTSSRLTTQNKFSFQYGRIEIRAKLPFGGGTWPALWMMGTNLPEVGWPNCGEIDIMEHSGNNQNVIHGSLHFPGNFGGNAVSETTTKPGVSDEFNNYTVEWDADQIQFAINDVVYHTFQNSSELPFNDEFFLIMNVAMGGTFVGGTVDPEFEESAMEIDYIRVYQ